MFFGLFLDFACSLGYALIDELLAMIGQQLCRLSLSFICIYV